MNQRCIELVRAMVLSTLTRLYIVPRMGEFFDRYPSISVELLNFDRPPNLIEEGIDVAIHSGELSDSSLIAMKIAETSIVLVATPEYLEKHGTPKRKHHSVAYMHQGAPRPWVFEKKSIRIVHQPNGNLRTSDAEQMRVAVLNHLGIANGPAWLFAEEIASVGSAAYCLSMRGESPYLRLELEVGVLQPRRPCLSTFSWEFSPRISSSFHSSNG